MTDLEVELMWKLHQATAYIHQMSAFFMDNQRWTRLANEAQVWAVEQKNILMDMEELWSHQAANEILKEQDEAAKAFVEEWMRKNWKNEAPK